MWDRVQFCWSLLCFFKHKYRTKTQNYAIIPVSSRRAITNRHNTLTNLSTLQHPLTPPHKPSAIWLSPFHRPLPLLKYRRVLQSITAACRILRAITVIRRVCNSSDPVISVYEWQWCVLCRLDLRKGSDGRLFLLVKCWPSLVILGRKFFLCGQCIHTLFSVK